MLSLENGLFSGSICNLYGFLRGQFSMTFDHGDVILFEQVLNPFAHLVSNSPAAGDDGIEIGCGILDLYPVICSVMGVFQHLCGFKQGFRGNTSPVQANTSQFGTFYDGHGHS